MSLPSEAVYPMLQRHFVLGWKNIRREEYVGDSSGYSHKQTCVGTTNGAGASNVQLFVMSPDRVVLHALPGFWHPDDLKRELEFSLVMWRLWNDDTRNREQKEDMFRRLQLTELRFHTPETYARSDWQGFDMSHEARVYSEERDTFERSDDGKLKRSASGAPRLKPINVLVHDRMSWRPFLPFDDFDTAAFIDYGRKFYDLNVGVDGRGKRLK